MVGNVEEFRRDQSIGIDVDRPFGAILAREIEDLKFLRRHRQMRELPVLDLAEFRPDLRGPPANRGVSERPDTWRVIVYI